LQIETKKIYWILSSIDASLWKKKTNAYRYIRRNDLARDSPINHASILD